MAGLVGELGATPTKSYTQCTPPRRLNCWVELRRRCVHNSQLVGDSLDESEQICQQRSRVASCRRYERTRRQSWPSLQFSVLLSYWGWAVSQLHKWGHNDVIVEKVINIVHNHVSLVKPLCSVPKLSTESVGSRRELVAIVFIPPTRRNSIVESRGVGGVHWALAFFGVCHLPALRLNMKNR